MPPIAYIWKSTIPKPPANQHHPSMFSLETISASFLNFFINFFKTLYNSLFFPGKFFFPVTPDKEKIDRKVYLYISLFIYLLYFISMRRWDSTLTRAYKDIDQFVVNITTSQKFLLTIPLFLFCVLVFEIIDRIAGRKMTVFAEMMFFFCANTLLLEVIFYGLLHWVSLVLHSYFWSTPWFLKYEKFVARDGQYFNLATIFVGAFLLIGLFLVHRRAPLAWKRKTGWLYIIIIIFTADNIAYNTYLFGYRNFMQPQPDFTIADESNDENTNFKAIYSFTNDSTCVFLLKVLVKNNTSRQIVNQTVNKRFQLISTEQTQKDYEDFDTAYQRFYAYLAFDSVSVLKPELPGYFTLSPGGYQVVHLYKRYKVDSVFLNWLSIRFGLIYDYNNHFKNFLFRDVYLSDGGNYYDADFTPNTVFGTLKDIRYIMDCSILGDSLNLARLQASRERLNKYYNPRHYYINGPDPIVLMDCQEKKQKN